MIHEYALIIGAMKGGTTSLFTWLGQHPQIAVSRVKEPNFFATPRDHAKGSDWYEEQFDWRPGRHSIAVEASPSYTKTPRFAGVPARIATHPAHFRFVYVLRDPVDRFESHYNHNEVRGRRQVPIDQGFDPRLVATSQYARQLDAYCGHFDRGRILLVDFQDLTDSPHETLGAVCEFLDVDPTHRFAETERTFNSFEARARMGTAARRDDDAPAMARARVRLHGWATRALGRRPVRTRLTPAQRSGLALQLCADVARLRTEYGFDASRWHIDELAALHTAAMRRT